MGDLGGFEELMDETRWGPAPDWLQAMADAVSRDLGDGAPLAVAVRFAPDPGADYLGRVHIRFSNGAGGGGFSIGLFDEPARQLVDVADAIQDEWCETGAGWAQARPACPGHAHPARAVAEDGAAWWSCPRDGRRLAPIGALSPPSPIS